MSLVGRLMNVFVSPGEVFDDIRGAEHSVANWLVPGVILILVGWLGSAWILSQEPIQQQMREIGEKNIEKQIAKSKVSEQQAQQMRQIGEKYGSLGLKISVVTMPVMLGLIVPFIWGLFIWVVGSKILKGGFSYLKGVEVVGLANMIAVLHSVVKCLLITMKGNVMAGPSLALLVKDFDPQNPVHNVMVVLDVMTFWVLAVRASGLARLSRVSFLKAALWVFGIWIGYTAFFTGIGFAVQAAVGKH
jgi:hypothetical protein